MLKGAGITRIPRRMETHAARHCNFTVDAAAPDGL